MVLPVCWRGCLGQLRVRRARSHSTDPFALFKVQHRCQTRAGNVMEFSQKAFRGGHELGNQIVRPSVLGKQNVLVVVQIGRLGSSSTR